MVDIDILPIPDWGLKCPQCLTPLAGMTSHTCARCAAPLDMCQIIATTRPVPPVGLACPGCGYDLTGLTRNRCPECGRSFYLRYLLQAPKGIRLQLGMGSDPPDCHVPKRNPLYTGRERPLPDFGLNCPECEHPLAGVEGELCPACGAFLDLPAIPPGDSWVDIGLYIPPAVAPIARRVLYEASVPYMVDSGNWAGVYGFGATELVSRLLVPRVFFLDAMETLTRAVSTDQRQIPAWVCPRCEESVPAGFEICWKCGGDYTPGAAKPADPPEDERDD